MKDNAHSLIMDSCWFRLHRQLIKEMGRDDIAALPHEDIGPRQIMFFAVRITRKGVANCVRMRRALQVVWKQAHKKGVYFSAVVCNI